MGSKISTYVWDNESGAVNDMEGMGIREADSTSLFSSVTSRKRTSNCGSCEPLGFKRKKNEASPKEIIKLDTAKYLHQKLFIEGHTSDVTIAALGHEWHLHKIYLEQCEYFQCLFSGNWLDSKEKRYELEITDQRITYQGLNTVFASLYQNEIEFTLEDLSGILSSSMLFNLQTCINRCEELMLRYIDETTVVEFIDLSRRYGCMQSHEKCAEFLSRLFWKLAVSDEFLQKLSYDTMVTIFEQPLLCVSEGEKDLYSAMKRWIYINETGKLNSSLTEIQQFFIEKPLNYFYSYKSLLSHIRLQHMITSKRTLECLRSEHIVGKEILNSVIQQQWETFLSNEEKQLLPDTLTDEYFYANCRRLGRNLNEDKCWRWAGLDFGLDLLFRCHFGMITMIRNINRDIVPHSLSFRKEYKVHFRLLVLNWRGEVITDTKRKMLNMFVDQKMFIASYPTDLKDFSVHLFYINHVPARPIEEYWKDAPKQSSC